MFSTLSCVTKIVIVFCICVLRSSASSFSRHRGANGLTRSFSARVACPRLSLLFFLSRRCDACVAFSDGTRATLCLSVFLSSAILSFSVSLALGLPLFCYSVVLAFLSQPLPASPPLGLPLFSVWLFLPGRLCCHFPWLAIFSLSVPCSYIFSGLIFTFSTLLSRWQMSHPGLQQLCRIQKGIDSWRTRVIVVEVCTLLASSCVCCRCTWREIPPLPTLSLSLSRREHTEDKARSLKLWRYQCPSIFLFFFFLAAWQQGNLCSWRAIRASLRCCRCGLASTPRSRRESTRQAGTSERQQRIPGRVRA